ncbi:hypothetical protein BMS3Abin10_01902 [bacterium BMS3Abin10]|nr:hypothetical protein BMS3Abin10_01902 [bacterium BMS3Abin10]GBE38244.1 hypothetical protein BMS3Bbin08_00847 [bacterium BMS3Bbin08]
MTDIMQRLKNFFISSLWEIDTNSLGRYKAFLVKTLRLLYVAAREFTEGQLNLRAMGLVYTVLLSIVPVLAISLSVLKAFGVHNEVVEPFLLKFLAPLGVRGEEITVQIIGFVENIDIGVLGFIGLALLIYTVISVIQKIERAFNSIWRIRKTRGFARRFSDYISVIIIGPVLVFAALVLTASIRSNALVQMLLSVEPFGTLFYYSAKFLPYILVCAAFTFFYVFIPNTKVKFSSALTGGIIAGVLWETAGWAFASFVVSSTKYTVIYSGFAILIMFMIWLYLSWLILLVGAQISFYQQYPQFLTATKDVFRLSNKLRERLVFSVMFLIGENYYYNKKPWTLESIVDHLGLPMEPVQDVIALLEKNKLILETGDDPPAFLPSRDIETIKLSELLNAVRIAVREALSIEQRIYSIPDVDDVMKRLDDSINRTLGDETVKSLVLSHKNR